MSKFERGFKSIEEMVLSAATMVRPKEKLTVSQWAEKYRYINNPGSYVGPWDNKKAPYLVEVMDTLASLDHTAVAFVGPARSGKSDLAFNFLGYTAHHDPADMSIYFMSNFYARDWSQSDLAKVFAAKPPTAKRSIFEQLLMPGKQNRNTFDIRFMSGMRLNLRWPAITEVSGKTFPRGLLNDYDHMEQDVAKMGSPFDLVRKRSTSFKRFAMTYAESTPAFPVVDQNWIAETPHQAPPVEEGILKVYNQGDRRRWYWRCLNTECRESFEPDFDLFDYDMDAGRGDPVAIGRSVKMICPCCGHGMTQDDRYQLNLGGKWLKDGQTWDRHGVVHGDPPNNPTASFWLKGPAALFQDWPTMVTRYVQAMREFENTRTVSSLKATMEVDQGKPFVTPRDKTSRLPEDLKSRAEDWGGSEQEPVVPEGVRFLVATVDVQARAFVVQITGIGEGGDLVLVDMFKIRKSNRIDENDKRREHAIIDPAGYPEDWDVLISEVIERTYPLADGSGRRMVIKITGCDSGGKEGVTANAYEFYRRLRDDPQARGHHRRFHLVKGEASRTAPRRRRTYPDAGRKDRHSGARGDVPVELLNANLLKDQVYAMLGRTEPGGGMIRFPIWTPNWCYQQLTAETRTDKGWENKSGRRNEALDLTYYVLGLCLTPDIRLEHMDWSQPDKIPAWAKPWDHNILIVKPEEKNPLIETKKETVDLTKLAGDWM